LQTPLNDRLLRLGGRARLVLEIGTQTRYSIDVESLKSLVDDLGVAPPKGL
jgi:hypothetical protein